MAHLAIKTNTYLKMIIIGVGDVSFISRLTHSYQMCILRWLFYRGGVMYIIYQHIILYSYKWDGKQFLLDGYIVYRKS